MMQSVEHSGSAIISPCGIYRYSLSRRWDDGEGTVVFIMLNPSTADALQDDPTIRRCVGFAKGWGYARLNVVNLFAFRATEPRELKTAHDPIGPENDYHIHLAGKYADVIIAAWGSHGVFKGIGEKVLSQFHGWREIHCLGLTKKGQPRHPLYLRGDLEPVEMPERSG